MDEGHAVAERIAGERSAAALENLVPLQSIVDEARRTFAAQACSVMVHERDSQALRFAAVSGEGSDSLVGVRIPDTTGIAGVVLAAREPLFLDDVASDRRFAEDLAETIGYVPKRLIATPLLFEDRVLGVLEILDGLAGARFGAREMAKLEDFAGRASHVVAFRL
jgi:GAF domain-containing protein